MTTNPHHLTLLRDELLRQDLTGFIIPLTDEHMSEYVGDYAERLAWVTGFTGSAGWAVVLLDRAAVFVDGRYVIQVVGEVDTAYIEHVALADMSLHEWLEAVLSKREHIGFDPELATVDWVKATQAVMKKSGSGLVAVTDNPIDAVWKDQPPRPMATLACHPSIYAGEDSHDKRMRLGATLKKKNVDAAVITMLDNVAWLLNIRGKDVTHTPVPHAFALIHDDGHASLFVHPDKMTDAVRLHLGNGVDVQSRDDFYPALTAMGKAGKRVLVDPMTNNARVFASLKESGATLVRADDPCLLAKAQKNPIEQEGTRQAHIRDAIAICRFLAWFDENAPKGQLDELGAAAKLWSYRKDLPELQDASFRTISAAGPNAAMAHYSVDEKSNRAIKRDEIYLVDSGGQYFDGTTDITRTMIVGTPSAEHKDRFTRVLKGHIALATTRFPAGTSGQALDMIARRALWSVGRDYDHGTGHGVGSYLAVHEGPQRIAKFASSAVALKPGMILSNEPGYYKAGEYGIRIENLVLVVPCVDDPERRGFMEFETLTFAPIDRRLIDLGLLSDHEIDWLNAYHAEVLDKIGPLVPASIKPWLEAATAPLAP